MFIVFSCKSIPLYQENNRKGIKDDNQLHVAVKIISKHIMQQEIIILVLETFLPLMRLVLILFFSHGNSLESILTL